MKTKAELIRLQKMREDRECGKPVKFTETSAGAFNPIVYWYVCEDGHETGCSKKIKACIHTIK